MELKQILKILTANRSKPFIQRVLKPIDTGLKNEKGEDMSHVMAWGENKDKTEFYVYPTVTKVKGKFIKFADKDAAWKVAQAKGNYISFDNKAEAAAFSKEYKKVWNKANGSK